LTPSTTKVVAEPDVMVPFAAEYTGVVGSNAAVAKLTAVKFVAVAMLGALK
jgi:hypothetical protein